jgi:hypothetical protein
MNTLANRLITVLVSAVLLLGLPLAGVALKGYPVAQYLEFPPLTQYVEHAGFSWPLFAAGVIVLAAILLPFVLYDLRNRPYAIEDETSAITYPWWGWLGLLGGAVSWVLAWSRFSWFAPLQGHTFSPLWLAYILVVNAWAFRRTGKCMLRDRPRYLLMLFVCSAAFWWFFEYLNRFVQNWHYVGTGTMSRMEYFIYATLPFSTVLPAVLGTYELLASWPRAGASLNHYVPIMIGHPRKWAAAGLCLAGVALLGIGVWPDLLFPLLWLSPLFIITCVQTLTGRETLFSELHHGRWRRIYLLAVSALVCGLFWEMWNHWSLAQWEYTVPYVGEFKIFKMPLLGYAGYLPFGIECGVIADSLVNGSWEGTSVSDEPCKGGGDTEAVTRNS